MASFNFKSFVKNIADKAQSEISPHRRPSQSTTPSEEAAEGFICPGCMSSFLTPQDLEIHYDQEHLNGNSTSNGNNLGHLKEEVQELQTTLKEEQFYSTELKKEVERLSTAVHKSTEESAVETSEIDLYETQIKALSEAKDLLTNEVIELKDKLDNAHARLVESDQISLKAAKIATENVEMKSKLDEALTEKRIYEEKMQLLETLINEKNNTGIEI